MILRKLLPLIASIVIFSCTTKTVTNTEDYSAYLNTKIDSSELFMDVEFWTNKIEIASNQYPFLANRSSAYTSVFSKTGNIDYLIKAENDLIAANRATQYNKATLLRGLASNYISQHRFKEALVLLEKAKLNGEKLAGTKKMMFDVHLELGNYILAESYLTDIKNTSDFDYLIRLAKWEDHKGNLDQAIVHMEAATEIAESSNLKHLKQWSYTNLADFYGHAGSIDRSYRYFLKALDLYPNDAYAKRGIAWIAYSHENNPEEALRILNEVSSYYKAPDYNLLKAEIADYQNDFRSKSAALKAYKSAVSNTKYGEMYNAYNVMVHTEDLLMPDLALKIAQREVENRPTPESYDLLAWSFFKLGNVERANSIVENYIEGQSSEPNVLYHVAEIYKAVGKTDKVNTLKTELVASLYELGPTMKEKIKQL